MRRSFSLQCNLDELAKEESIENKSEIIEDVKTNESIYEKDEKTNESIYEKDEKTNESIYENDEKADESIYERAENKTVSTALSRIITSFSFL